MLPCVDLWFILVETKCRLRRKGAFPWQCDLRVPPIPFVSMSTVYHTYSLKHHWCCCGCWYWYWYCCCCCCCCCSTHAASPVAAGLWSFLADGGLGSCAAVAVPSHQPHRRSNPLEGHPEGRAWNLATDLVDRGVSLLYMYIIVYIYMYVYIMIYLYIYISYIYISYIYIIHDIWIMNDILWIWEIDSAVYNPASPVTNQESYFSHGPSKW